MVTSTSGSSSADSAVSRFEHQGLLGTVVDIRIGAPPDQDADKIDRDIVAEITRLSGLFSAYDSTSELSRWRRGEQFDQSDEFVDLMQAALDWQRNSEGIFNPLVGELTALWSAAAESGQVPDRSVLQRAAEAIQASRFELRRGGGSAMAQVVATADCRALNLNAFAKGHIVDRALAAVEDQGASWICVNAGGDLAHRGSSPIEVGIENPHRPYDNEPPVAIVRLANAALATSGPARRGFRVGSQWFGHVLDARTGWPVDAIASISVVASTAARADVLATVAGAGHPAEAVRQLQAHDADGLVIDREGTRWATPGWATLLVS